jgi:3-oxoacyl-[acyl-carrier protein] reductase
MGLLDGKVALITGGSRGIGAALVRRFADEGAAVAFTYRSSAHQADALVRAIEEAGGRARAYQSDAASYAQAEQLIQTVYGDWERVDVLVNNAGITDDTLLLRMKEEQWDRVVQTNLKSVFNLTRHIARNMMKARSGSMINISSIVGLTGNPGQANYAAFKAGIFGFTKSIAKELGSRGIRCNAVAPGFIETEMTDQLDEKVREAYLQNIPLKRMGSADEVADLCVFLGSDRSTYITGQVISVCGGLSD